MPHTDFLLFGKIGFCLSLLTHRGRETMFWDAGQYWELERSNFRSGTSCIMAASFPFLASAQALLQRHASSLFF
jgi:hypothetical protein